jgi:hypothetical protein
LIIYDLNAFAQQEKSLYIQGGVDLGNYSGMHVGLTFLKQNNVFSLNSAFLFKKRPQQT